MCASTSCSEQRLATIRAASPPPTCAENERAASVRAGLTAEQLAAFDDALEYSSFDAVDLVIGIVQDIEDDIIGGRLRAASTPAEKRIQAYQRIQAALGTHSARVSGRQSP